MVVARLREAVARTSLISGLHARVSARRPGHLSPAEQVNVKMINGLAAVAAGIDHGAIAAGQALRASYFGGGPLQVSEKLVVLFLGVSDRRDVLAGDDKHMNGSLWLDVGEGVALIILINRF